jgi:ATP-dependent DNA helicase DinG
VLSEELKITIQNGYSAFLEAKSFLPRGSQKQMIGRIASFLGSIDSEKEDRQDSESNVLAIEAGTGTGKTVAYLLSVLPVARALNKQVIVATGTVALQGQLVDRDIPDVMAATGWEYDYVVAKGRGRSLCPLRLQQSQQELADSNAGLMLYEDEVSLPADKKTAATLEQMATALADRKWHGDRDDWPEPVAQQMWSALTIDSSQCAGYRCRLFTECCFFRAREAIREADCVVVNHDLLLADLALGGGAILPEPAQSIYIIDEAHKLGASALSHFANFSRLNASIQWLEQIAKTLPAMGNGLIDIIGTQQHIETCLDMVARVLPVAKQSFPAFEILLEDSDPQNAGQYRFPGGCVGEKLGILCEQLRTFFGHLRDCIDGLHESLEQSLDDPAHSVPRVDIEKYFQITGQWLRRATGIAECWSTMANSDAIEPPLAKWLVLEDNGDICVSASPIIAGSKINELLWQSCYGAIATSATLCSLGSFARFCRETGLENGVNCVSVPTSFDYANAGVLNVPDIGADGGAAQAHTAALVEHLPDILTMDTGSNGSGKTSGYGSLVLFASRRQMDDVASEVKDKLASQILIQGEFSIGEMISRHRRVVDDGLCSVIFGLASFAEGMDLPGKYCEHVVIAKLPFAVPSDPLHAALAEWIEAGGGNAFRDLTLPDASLRLIQACGRLLRSETDTGRVTILDRRLLSKTYGRELLDSLPPFRRHFG